MAADPLRRRAQSLAIFIVVAGVCALAALGIWLGPGILNTRAGGDSPFLVIRTFELAANLRAGIVPARWMPDAAFGLGYPFFRFYAALPYYLAAGLNTLGLDLLAAIKLTQTIGMAAAAATMYVFARDTLPRWGAALAAAAYVLAPFHLVNVYVRGDSLSEFWAFVWYPLILWGVVRTVREAAAGRSWADLAPIVVGLALSLAALVLTHNVSALIFAPFIALYALAVLLRAGARAGAGSVVRCAVPLGAAALLGLALSAWFWLPALGEVGTVQLDDQTTGYFSFGNHFRAANLVQPTLWFDYTVNESLDAFAMSGVQLGAVAIGAATWLWRVRRTGRSLFDPLLVLACLVLSTFMITPLSAAVWERAPLLPFAQFPWRFLSVQAVFASVLIGGIAGPNVGPMRRLDGWIALPMMALLAGSALARLPNERLNIRAEDVTPQAVQMYEWYSGNIGTTIRHEYLPITAKPRPLTGPALLHMPRAAVIAQAGVAPDAVASALQFASPERQVWQLTARRSVTVALPVWYAPGWQVTVDDAPVRIWAHPGSGWLAMQLAAGSHRVVLSWTGTPGERVGLWISIVALAIVAVCILVALRAVPASGRALVTLGAGALIIASCLGLIAIVARLAPSAPEPPPLQTLDFARRPFPHRDPVRFRSVDGATYELIGASFEPRALRSSEAFTLTLRWRDDRAPSQVALTQELPMGGEFARLFRHARLQEIGDPRLGRYTVLSSTLPGPLLLKLTAYDAAGKLMQPIASDGSALQAPIAGKPAPAITLLGPAVKAMMTDTMPLAPPAVQFDNGIALQAMDWFFASAQEVCLRPVWRRTRADVNRADALQVSLRVFGQDRRLIVQADGQPQAGLAPTWSWPDDVLIHDSQCVPTQDVLMPDEPYIVQIVWYRLADLGVTGEAWLSGRAGPRLEDLNVPQVQP